MAKKVWKWIGFFGGIFAVSAVLIAVPLVTSSKAINNNVDKQWENYKLPTNLGSKVADSAFAYADESDYTSPFSVDNKRFQDAIENTYLFAGGNDFFVNWDDFQSARGISGLFEENVRWTLTARGLDNPSEVYSSLGRFCINISKPNQSLRDINNDYDFKVKNLDPKNVVTIVGSEYINTINIDKTLDEFETDLRTFVQNSLKLRNNTSNLILIKHWKIPNPNNDSWINQYNSNVEKLNVRTNKILSELTDDQIPRVLLVDDEDLFLDLNWQNNAYFDEDLNLSRMGCNEVAKSILATMKPYLRTTGKTWTPADWTDFSQTHLNATPLEWNTLETKNNLDISVLQSTKTVGTQAIATLTVSFPKGGVSVGDKLKWMIKFENPTIRIEDYSVVNDQNQIIIDNIFLNQAPTSNMYSLIVYDKDNHPFNVVDGDLSQTTTNTIISNNTTSNQPLTATQQKFIERFNDLSRPMVWSFVGDSIDHGAIASRGFDDIVEVVEKSVKNDWKRYDDIFINAAQAGNFTNRAVDPYQIEATITKYHPDVVSIGLGISDCVKVVANGQYTYTDENQFIANMKTLADAAKKANPNVIVVINAINPTTAERAAYPAIYNEYLKKAFGDPNSEYSSFVIYDENVFDELNYISTHYTFSQNDSLFVYTDRLHPGPNANLIKGKNFLEALGLNVENSYLSNYMLEEFTWWTGKPDDPIEPISSVTQGNKVVPEISSWANTYPLGGVLLLPII